VSEQGLIKTEYLHPGRTLPLVVQPAVDGLNLVAWAASNREFIEKHLLRYGGILFRNFNGQSIAEFEQFTRTISGDLLEYTYRSTPRTRVEGRIYTSTEYPADQAIPLHNENAYASTWPMKIWFFSVAVAQKGGETPIADSRKVFARIDPAIRKRFGEKKVMYVRNYRTGLDLSWQDVFQTEDRTAVEEFCRHNGIQCAWKADGSLRTRQICHAVAAHPKSGEMVWFNQAHLFHISSLRPQVREVLLATFREDDLPRNSYYGDGSPIEDSVLDEIRNAYEQESIAFPWHRGDILMLDNMLVAHGRRPFMGPRNVAVAMAEPLQSGDTLACAYGEPT